MKVKNEWHDKMAVAERVNIMTQMTALGPDETRKLSLKHSYTCIVILKIIPSARKLVEIDKNLRIIPRCATIVIRTLQSCVNKLTKARTVVSKMEVHSHNGK